LRVVVVILWTEDMLFYKSDYLEIYYEHEQKLVETRWLAFAPSKDYREGLSHYLDVIRRQEAKLWLGDYRLARVIRLEDQQWAAREWFPTFLPLAAGIERMARVQSVDVFSQVSSDNMKEKIDMGGLPFLFSEFRHYEDAKAWLLQETLGGLGKDEEMLG
jgi:hypothetical protein